MRHVFVCTTEYGDHWTRTIARTAAQVAAMSEEEHAAGCVVMIYPDGIWYRIRELADAEKVLEQHIIGGKPVQELIHRRVNPPDGKGVQVSPSPAGARFLLRSGLRPVTAVPAHLVEAAECCGDNLTPEQRAQARLA